MAIFPQYQTVVHQYERPTSTDFNAAQSYASMNDQLNLHAIYSGGASWLTPEAVIPGCVGYASLRVVSSGATAAAISPGIALMSSSEQTNINNISGLSRFSTLQAVTCSYPKTVPILPGPGAGFIRRDIIAIKPPAVLAARRPTDIFNPALQSFDAPTLLPKVMAPDLSRSTVQTLNYDGTAYATGDIVYVTGQSGTFNNTIDGYLAVPIPPVPDGYMLLAVIGRPNGGTTVDQSFISDHRYILAPGGDRNQLHMRARIGRDVTTGYSTVFSYGFLNGGGTTPLALLRGLTSIDAQSNHLFELCIFTGRSSSYGDGVMDFFGQRYGLPLLTGVTPNPLNDGTTPVQLVPYEYGVGIADGFLFGDLQQPGRNPYFAQIAQWLSPGQPYLSVKFCLATSVPTAGSQALKLYTGAPTFGVDAGGAPVLAVDVDIQASWYPFSSSI